jgi:hypothetical protein
LTRKTGLIIFWKSYSGGINKINMRINNEIIRSLDPCYDPSEIGIPDDETLPVKEWVEKYRNSVTYKSDVIWLLCRPEYMSDRDMRLFAVWCAREALKLIANPDERSIHVLNVVERYATGEATQDELYAARAAARAAALAAAWAAASDTAWAAARDAAWTTVIAADRTVAKSVVRYADRTAARVAAMNAVRTAQIDKLLTYF